MILEFTEIEVTIPGDECMDMPVEPDAEAPEKLDLNMDNMFKVYAYMHFLIPFLDPLIDTLPDPLPDLFPDHLPDPFLISLPDPRI